MVNSDVKTCITRPQDSLLLFFLYSARPTAATGFTAQAVTELTFPPALMKEGGTHSYENELIYKSEAVAVDFVLSFLCLWLALGLIFKKRGALFYSRQNDMKTDPVTALK